MLVVCGGMYEARVTEEESEGIEKPNHKHKSKAL